MKQLILLDEWHHPNIVADDRPSRSRTSNSSRECWRPANTRSRNWSDGVLYDARGDASRVTVHGLREWRQRVLAVPQFHENHVLSSTFAFNLLMGREWPPTAADMDEALAVCDELGLGDLLTRMPSGLQQIVGETGWQLSHGEKSRLYIARALLHAEAPDVMVLDESFAALDPQTMERALECVLRRARALLVVAHP